MIKKKSIFGYTLIEVMFFLSISALTFTLTASLIRVRMRQVRYTQSVRDAENKIADLVNDLETGYVNNYNNVCMVNSTEIIVESTNETNKQATSSDCIVYGKAFFPSFDDSAIFSGAPLIGRRLSAEGRDVTGISQSGTKIGIPTISDDFNTMETSYQLANSLRITKFVDGADFSKEYLGFFILRSFPKYSTNGDQQFLNSGRSIPSIAGIPSTAIFNSSKASFLNAINNITDDSSDTTKNVISIPTKDGVFLCLEDSRGRRSSIRVGAGNSVDFVELKVDLNAGDACS